MYSMRSSESIYASTDPTSSLDQQPQSLPVFSAASPAVSCRAGDVSVGGLAQNTFYCQPNSAKSLHNLHRPPPIPSKPPRKLSERGLPLEHSRSVHQLHQPNIRPAAEPISVWSVAPVRRSNSNCSDRAVWRETNSMHNSNLPPQPVYSHLSNQASSVDMTSTPSANRHSSLPGQQTLRRFQVHCGDVYAQVDKSRKVTKSSSGKAGARHQRSKSEHTSNSADDDVEPIYSTIGRSSSKTASPDTAPVRIGEKRKKRATITIPLQVRSFDLDLNGKDAANNSTPPPPPPPLPPAPSHVEALPLIQKVCKQLRHVSKAHLVLCNTNRLCINSR